MNEESKKFQKVKKEIAELGDGELMGLERIVFNELIKRRARKMFLRLVERQK